jgi:branched-chain amino acid transport system substrate-binding protein
MEKDTSPVKRRSFLNKGMAGALAVSALSGCLGNGGSTTAEGELPDNVAFTLGAPLSGGSASIGEKIRDGARAALDDGGLMDDGIDGTGVGIELIEADTKCSSDGGSQAAQKQIRQNGVDSFFSTCTGGTLSSMPVSERNNTLHLTSALAGQITQQGHPSLIRTGFRADWISVPMGQFAYEQGLRRVAILHVDNGYGKSYADGFERGFTNAGGEVVRTDAYSYGSTDFGQFINNYENANNLDGVMEVGYTQHHRVFIPEFRNRVSELGLIAATDANDPSNVAAIGLDNYAGGGGTLGARIIADNEMAQQFGDQYTQMEGRDVAERFGAWGWNAINVIKRSIELSGGEDLLRGGISKSDDSNETAEMVQALKDADGLEMVWGNDVTFNQNGDMYFNVRYGEYTDSGFEGLQQVPIEEGRQ